MNLPLILIFDIDQTIIGNQCTFEQEYYILNDVPDNKKLLVKYNSFLDNYLKTIDFIRPHFLDFIKLMKDKYVKVEIFLYTNSGFERVEFLEKVLSKYFKFKKIYSRRDSINMQKNILFIYEDIIKTLKLTKHKKEILENNIIFIDDIPNNLGDYSNKQIVCTRYNNIYTYDLQAKLLKDYDIDMLKNKEIIQTFNDNKHYMYYYDPNSYSYEDKDFYLYNLKKLIIQRKEVILNKYNDFFLKLIEIIKKEKYKLFNTETIENINKLLIVDNDK